MGQAPDLKSPIRIRTKILQFGNKALKKCQNNSAYGPEYQLAVMDSRISTLSLTSICQEGFGKPSTEKDNFQGFCKK
jgi:hypothetical protein